MNKNDIYVVGIIKPQFLFEACKDCEYYHPEGICDVGTDSLLFKILEPDIFTFEEFFDAVKYATGIFNEFQSQSVIFKREDSKIKLIMRMGLK